MKFNSGSLGSLVLAVLLVFCLILIANDSFAAVDSEDVPQDGKIEIVYPAVRTAPYRERRGAWSTIFALNVDQVLPDKFRSQVNNESYQDLFGSTPVRLVQAEIGMKYNFPLGSLGAALLYGGGAVEDGHGLASGATDELELTKKGAAFSFVMDNLFPEPYVAPYIEAQAYNFDWRESRTTQEKKTGSTAFGSALTFGALFQLNWLDSASALQAQDTIGLNNTYLDIFVSQYNSSESESDPNFQTDLNYGAGVRLEF